MQTTCEIGGQPYKLFYEKQSTAGGMYFHGQVLNQAQLHFSFTEGLDNKTTAFGTFQPHTEPPYVQKAVIHAIREFEASQDSNVFRNAGE